VAHGDDDEPDRHVYTGGAFTANQPVNIPEGCAMQVSYGSGAVFTLIMRGGPTVTLGSTDANGTSVFDGKAISSVACSTTSAQFFIVPRLGPAPFSAHN
jgi:hypothetical protein